MFSEELERAGQMMVVGGSHAAPLRRMSHTHTQGEDDPGRPAYWYGTRLHSMGRGRRCDEGIVPATYD